MKGKGLLKTGAVSLGTLMAAGFYFTNKVMYLKKKTDEEIIERETAVRRHFSLKDFESWPKETIRLRSSFGYDICGCYIPAAVPSKKFMIFCHGVTVNKLNSVKYASLFLKRGFNVLIYDHRRHGQTGGRTTSYGYYEKYDLKTVVRWLKKRFGEDILLGIHGESMGAATLLQYAGMLEDGADFYIADCPFSDFDEQLRYLLKTDYHLPRWPLFPIAKLFIRVRDGYAIRDVSPLRAVKNIDHPALFIHSKNDRYVKPEMTMALYEAKSGNKQLFIAEKGAHACSYADNEQDYEQAIDHFLSDYVYKK